MLLQELFDKAAVAWHWTDKTDEAALARFKVDKIEYEFVASVEDEEQDKYWNIEFRAVEGPNKFGLTGTGNSQKVMATVVAIMKDFIKLYDDKITTITFSAKEDSRRALYGKMIKKLIPDWPLSTGEDKHTGLEFTLRNPRVKSSLLGRGSFARRGVHAPQTAADLQGAGLPA